MRRLTASTLFLALLFSSMPPLLWAGADTSDLWIFRTIDGSGNHVAQADRGQAHTPLIRVAAPGHGDGVDLPRGVPVEDEGDGNVEVDEQTLPSARAISNAVHDQNSDGGQVIFSSRRLNQLFFQFGQFISHDIGLTESDFSVATGGSSGFVGNEWFPIPVPATDPDFPFSEIAVFRSIAEAPGVSDTGRREHINTITAFIDGSNIYGSDEVRAGRLRSRRGGRLQVSSGDLLPLNLYGEENANPVHADPASLFLAGDVRANEQVGLTAMHTLFVREHNRLAREIAGRDFPGANLDDPFVDELIYQRARATVGAILQNITFSEWLPTLFGSNRLGGYRGYTPGVDPQLSNVFSSAAFRIGHTMLPPNLGVDPSPGYATPLPLKEAFFNPDFVSSNGVDPIFRGFARSPQQKIDRFIVDDVRNFLFGPSGLDLAALNIQRGRDHCLPSYNLVRQSFGLSPRFEFSAITPEAAAQAGLRTAYGAGGIDDLDIWSGGITEQPLRGSSLGESFTAIFTDQFSRLRDGDRFFFKNRQIYSPAFIQAIEATTLAAVIRRNTGLSHGEANDFSFFPPGYHPYQVDLRIGPRRGPRHHVGDDVYNSSGTGQYQKVSKRRPRPILVFVSIENDGAFSGGIRARMSGASRRKVKTVVTEFGAGGIANVTASMLRGVHEQNYFPEETRVLRAKFKSRRRSRPRTVVRPVFHGASIVSSTARDVVRCKLRFR